MTWSATTITMNFRFNLDLFDLGLTGTAATLLTGIFSVVLLSVVSPVVPITIVLKTSSETSIASKVPRTSASIRLIASIEVVLIVRLNGIHFDLFGLWIY